MGRNFIHFCIVLLGISTLQLETIFYRVDLIVWLQRLFLTNKDMIYIRGEGRALGTSGLYV